jgi:S1-C subfamily serine protease
MTAGRKLATLLVATLFVAASLAAGTVPQGWLGFGFLTHRAANGTIDFLHVRNVAKGGPADRAGLRPLDVIVALNGTPVRFRDDRAALAFFAHTALGQRVVVTVVRSGQPRRLAVVAARPPNDQSATWERNRALAVPSKPR